MQMGMGNGNANGDLTMKMGMGNGNGHGIGNGERRWEMERGMDVGRREWEMEKEMEIESVIMKSEYTKHSTILLLHTLHQAYHIPQNTPNPLQDEQT